jgi:hypothetical protein
MTYGKQVEKLQAHVSADVWEELCRNKAMICGGAVTSVFTGQPINDLDVYFESEFHFRNCKQTLERYAIMCHETPKSLMFIDHVTQGRINLIRLNYFDSISDVFNAFDLSVNMAGFDCNTGKFHLTHQFITDNMNKVLHISRNALNPIYTLARVLKYQKRGYSISGREMIYLGFIIADTDVSSWEDVQANISGSSDGSGETVPTLPVTTEFNMDAVLNALDNHMDMECVVRQPVPVEIPF